MDTWTTLEPLYDHFDGIARSLTGPMVSHAAAEDAVQDALMDLKRRLDSGAKIENPRAWLERRAKGAAQDYIEQQNREIPDGPEPDQYGAYETYQPDPFIQAEQRVDLISAIDALTDTQREVFTLVELRGLSEREAAAKLGLSRSTVNRRYEAARKTLQRELS